MSQSLGWIFSERNLKWLAVIAVVLCGIAIYGSSLQNGYIWDDDYYVYKNGLVQTPGGLRGIWFSHALPQYYPVVFTSFWIEYKFWGLNPFGYHTVNLFLHLLNALLVLVIVRRLNPKAAFPVAFLFTVHPIQVETVAWITERKNLLGLFFFLLTFLCYLRFETCRKLRDYVLALICFALALLSKSVSVCFAVLPLLYIWWRTGKIKVRNVLETIPFFVIGFSAALHTAYLEVHRAGAHGEAWNFDWIEKTLLAGRILFFYIQKLIVPVNFMFFYPRWSVNALEIWQWLFPVLAIVILILSYVNRARLGRGGFCLSLFYIASIFPALGFFNVFPMQYSYVADHFSYLSLPALLLLIVSAFLYVSNRIISWIKPATRQIWKIAGWTGFGIIAFALSMESWALTHNYKNSFTLWNNLIKANPDSAAAHINLGSAYLNAGNPMRALPLFQKAVELAPKDFIAYNNLASTFKALGQPKEAIVNFHKAVEINPDFFFGFYNLGLLYHETGNNDFAIAALRKAIEANRNYAPAYLAMGNISFALKEYPDAINFYQQTLMHDPTNAPAYSNLALIFKGIGKTEMAEEMFRRAQIILKDNENIQKEMKNIPT